MTWRSVASQTLVPGWPARQAASGHRSRQAQVPDRCSLRELICVEQWRGAPLRSLSFLGSNTTCENFFFATGGGGGVGCGVTGSSRENQYFLRPRPPPRPLFFREPTTPTPFTSVQCVASRFQDNPCTTNRTVAKHRTARARLVRCALHSASGRGRAGACFGCPLAGGRLRT